MSDMSTVFHITGDLLTVIRSAIEHPDNHRQGAHKELDVYFDDQDIDHKDYITVLGTLANMHLKRTQG